MLGQAINITRDPRPATPQEEMIWNRFLDRYDRLTKTAKGIISTAHVAADFQNWFTQKGIPIKCWDETDQRYIDSFLHRYNIVGRIISGSLLGKYFMAIEQGDLAIVAPSTMPSEQYEQDIYPGAIDQELGIAPLVVIGLIAGTALIVGGIVTVEALDYSGRAKDNEYREKVLQADLAVLQQSKETQAAWRAMKQQSAELIAKANQEHGSSWFERLFGGGIAGIGGGIAVLIGLLVAYQLSKK